MNDEYFMKKAIELAAAAVAHGNEPFGAVLVKEGEIIFTNENQIYTRHDPTFHGEAGLIREFCAQTGSPTCGSTHVRQLRAVLHVQRRYGLGEAWTAGVRRKQ